MIDFQEILQPDCVLAGAPIVSKKAALEAGAELIASSAPRFQARQLLDALLARERLGSTALGEGVAIPHCRSTACTSPKAALLQLAQPVDFDGEPVDLLFVLVVPEEETRAHLEILGALARIFDEPTHTIALRNASSNTEFHDAFQHLINEVFAE